MPQSIIIPGTSLAQQELRLILVHYVLANTHSRWPSAFILLDHVFQFVAKASAIAVTESVFTICVTH
jgi:hypothetical protein|tara:strand:- start:240 stop:440 length:201 start_codon:yes stop_codon:yes gene_type:complete